MDTPNDDLAQLFREIRDSQRELLSSMKAWEERSEKRYAEQNKEYQADRNQYDKDRAQWQREQDEWSRHGWTRFVAAVAILTSLCVISAVMAIGIARTFGWFD